MPGGLGGDICLHVWFLSEQWRCKIILDCRTQGMTLSRTVSDCRTVGLSDVVFDSLTLFDTARGSRLSETVSDSCRTLSDCRTVGLSEVSECRTGAQACIP